MKWNWQQIDWPNFYYNQEVINKYETDFLYRSGIFIGTYKHLNTDDKNQLTVNLISNEALKTSEIEGEFLNRDSLQSSIRKHFGLATDHRRIPAAEQGIADMMLDLYENFKKPLDHQTLFRWNMLINNARYDIKDIGCYRTQPEPMQVVSGSIDNPKIHFEAPPANTLKKEMDQFIKWFNDSGPNGKKPLPSLIRSSIAHLYFVSIHPFEDGNGRIARSLAEKALSQYLQEPPLTGLSTLIQKNRKDYYLALEKSNKDNEITDWIRYFSETIIAAQDHTQASVNFFIEKTKLYDLLRGKLNPRQDKALQRMFQEGIEGFRGGLSAENYLSMTKTTRATATRDLQDLVKKEALLRTGRLKNTRYWLNIPSAQINP